MTLTGLTVHGMFEMCRYEGMIHSYDISSMCYDRNHQDERVGKSVAIAHAKNT